MFHVRVHTEEPVEHVAADTAATEETILPGAETSGAAAVRKAQSSIGAWLRDTAALRSQMQPADTYDGASSSSVARSTERSEESLPTGNGNEVEWETVHKKRAGGKADMDAGYARTHPSAPRDEEHQVSAGEAGSGGSKPGTGRFSALAVSDSERALPEDNAASMPSVSYSLPLASSSSDLDENGDGIPSAHKGPRLRPHAAMAPEPAWGRKLRGAPLLSDSVDPGADDALERANKSGEVAFLCGNPRIDIVTGKVRIFRRGAAGAAAPGTPGALPGQRGPVAAILAVPAYMTIRDLFAFLTPSIVAEAARVHIVRDASPFHYMAILQFRTQDAADALFLERGGRRFSSLDDTRCYVAFVASVEFAQTGSANPWQLGPDRGTMELPSCPVCLERLDDAVSGLVTTVCNHWFHSQCLSQCRDSTCPVCRYCQEPSSCTPCSVCGSTEELWICVVCGHVGCGRYAKAHAVQHYKETGHALALELDTQRVWNYASDGYVHRLVVNKVDGSVLELPASPAASHVPAGPPGAPASAARLATNGNDAYAQQPSTAFTSGDTRMETSPRKSSGNETCHRRTEDACGGRANPTKDDTSLTAQDASRSDSEAHLADKNTSELEKGIPNAKLEALSIEYSTLLVSQLETQREYFEHEIREREEAYIGAAARTEAETAQLRDELGMERARAAEAERARERDAKRVSRLRTTVEAMKKECDELRALNDSLAANQRDWEMRERRARDDAAELRAQNTDLREQVRDLMLYIEASQTVQANPSLQNGAIGVANVSPPLARRKRRGK